MCTINEYINNNTSNYIERCVSGCTNQPKYKYMIETSNNMKRILTKYAETSKTVRSTLLFFVNPVIIIAHFVPM